MQLIDRAREAWGFLLTRLNAFGSIVLAYALLNPTAASDLLNLLPKEAKIPAALAMPAAWFLLVQYAKVRAVKRAA